MNLYSRAGRAKHCKKDSRYAPLCTKRRATSGENLNTILQKKKEKKPQIQILKVDKISEILWEITHIGIVLLQERNTMYVPKNDFPVLLNYIDVQRQPKTNIVVLHEATIEDY